MKLEQPRCDVVDHEIKPVAISHIKVAGRRIHDVCQVHIFIDMILRANERIEDVSGQNDRSNVEGLQKKRKRVVAMRVQMNDLVFGMTGTKVAAV